MTLELHLGKEIDDVLRATVQLGVASLSAETLHLGHGDALDADAAQRFLHFVELERLDDRFDLFHFVTNLPDARPKRSRASPATRFIRRTERDCKSRDAAPTAFSFDSYDPKTVVRDSKADATTTRLSRRATAVDVAHGAMRFVAANSGTARVSGTTHVDAPGFFQRRVGLIDLAHSLLGERA